MNMKKNQVSYTINHAELTQNKELGRGGFGVVYRGTYRHSDVAIKQLLMENISAAAAQEFESEAVVMAQLRSPNIVQFYGYCLSPHYCIVMEYMANGSLFSVLHSQNPLDWPKRFNIAIDIAKGLSFLHHEKILHRDVKSLNVLLDKQYQAKLTDFGLSKVKTETKSHHMATKTKSDSVGTIAWMAPELFVPKAVYTPKADIYSLGITFWELAARQIPYKGEEPMLIPGWVKDGHREDIPEDCPQELAALIIACWDGIPDKRPTADEVVTRLKKVTELLSEPISNPTLTAPAVNSGPNYQMNLNSEPVASSTPFANPAFTQELQEVESLLKKAALNEKTEEHENAEKFYQGAIKKAKESNVPDDTFIKVYVAYGEYLLRQNKKAEGDKQLRIAANFGYVRQEIVQPTPIPVQKPVKIQPQSPFNLPQSQIVQNPGDAIPVPIAPNVQKPQQQPVQQPQPAPPAVVQKPANPVQQSSPVVIFTPPPPKITPAQSIPKVNPQELTQFLTLVAQGEQDKAEAMLKSNKDLVLVPGDVTDLSKRTFKGITAFQYALWALDWHMWTMLLKYIPTPQAQEQAKQVEYGSWVLQHGTYANWDKLTNALENCVQLWNQSKWEQGNQHWVQQVGGAQLLLPAHVINEYCHPTRSFNPCPDFTKLEPNGTWRTRQTDKGEWFTAQYNDGSLGVKFAVARGAYSRPFAMRWGIHERETNIKTKLDHAGVRALYDARTQQRSRLLTELAPAQQLKAS